MFWQLRINFIEVCYLYSYVFGLYLLMLSCCFLDLFPESQMHY